MRIVLSLLTSALVLVGASALADEGTNDFLNNTWTIRWNSQTFGQLQGQTWMTNFYGKTLSSLGEIVSLRIDRKDGSSHRDLWQIIEESTVEQQQPFNQMIFVAAPLFAIEYSSGIRVQAARCHVIIFLPDGRKGSAYLKPSRL